MNSGIKRAKAQSERIRWLWEKQHQRMAAAVRGNARKHGTWKEAARNERRAMRALLAAANELVRTALTQRL